MMLVGISAVLALVNLLLWAWLHEKGESQHIGPVMAGLGITVTSAFVFVLVESERSPVALWLIGQLVARQATFARLTSSRSARSCALRFRQMM